MFHVHKGTTYVDVYDALPGVNIDYDRYAQCERERLTPLLEKSGFELLGSWYTGEGDSFGPLSRAIRARKHGLDLVLVYG